MKNIVVINGTGGCGKDTFIKLISKYKKVYNFSSIDKVKEIARIIGWDGTKDEKSRKFLSDLKNLTKEYNDMPYNCTKEAIEEFKNSDCEIMFIHIREPEEIKRIVDTFGAKTLFIKRENLNDITSNSSDGRVSKYKYDYSILNTTLEEYEKKACEFINWLEKA
mgnify:CR=1 FL=1